MAGRRKEEADRIIDDVRRKPEPGQETEVGGSGVWSSGVTDETQGEEYIEANGEARPESAARPPKESDEAREAERSAQDDNDERWGARQPFDDATD